MIAKDWGSRARRDDEAMPSIVEEEQRSHRAPRQARTVKTSGSGTREVPLDPPILTGAARWSIHPRSERVVSGFPEEEVDEAHHIMGEKEGGPRPALGGDRRGDAGGAGPCLD